MKRTSFYYFLYSIYFPDIACDFSGEQGNGSLHHSVMKDFREMSGNRTGITEEVWCSLPLLGRVKRLVACENLYLGLRWYFIWGVVRCLGGNFHVKLYYLELLEGFGRGCDPKRLF